MDIFANGLNEAARIITENAEKHGFWDVPKEFGTTIALVAGETAEAFEEFRSGHGMNQTYFKCPEHGNVYDESLIARTNAGLYVCRQCGSRMKPEGIPTEWADVIIRILDHCGHEGIDIDKACNEKHAYNLTRPMMHGKKI